MDGMTCAELHDAAPELALGILSGDERARALAHLEWCADCRADVENLTDVADGVIGLAPAGEPPVGFEDRVLRGFVAERRRHRPARRWVPAAAALAAVLGVGGWAIGSYATPSRPAPAAAPSSLRWAAFTDHGENVGDMFAYTGHPGWVYMQVDDLKASGPVTCELRQADGHMVAVGTFMLAEDGYGYWGGPARVDMTKTRGAVLVGGNNTVLASAVFRSAG